MPNWLLITMNTTGSSHGAARLVVSPKVPWVVAPGGLGARLLAPRSRGARRRIGTGCDAALAVRARPGDEHRRKRHHESRDSPQQPHGANARVRSGRVTAFLADPRIAAP